MKIVIVDERKSSLASDASNITNDQKMAIMDADTVITIRVDGVVDGGKQAESVTLVVPKTEAEISAEKSKAQEGLRHRPDDALRASETIEQTQARMEERTRRSFSMTSDEDAKL